MSKPSDIVSPTGSPFAVVVMFFGNGFVMASSYSRMPGIRDQLGSTPTQLAFALVCMGIGSIRGMAFTGRRVDRYSSRMVSLVATLICLGGWAMVPMARSVPVLALMLLITGVGTGVGDVAMNVQGHLVEVRRQRVLMPYWHGLFSLGALAASARIGSLSGRPTEGAGSQPRRNPARHHNVRDGPWRGRCKRLACPDAGRQSRGASGGWCADICGFQPDNGSRPVYRRGCHPALRQSASIACSRRSGLYRGGRALSGKFDRDRTAWRPC